MPQRTARPTLYGLYGVLNRRPQGRPFPGDECGTSKIFACRGRVAVQKDSCTDRNVVWNGDSYRLEEHCDNYGSESLHRNCDLRVGRSLHFASSLSVISAPAEILSQKAVFRATANFSISLSPKYLLTYLLVVLDVCSQFSRT